MNVLVKALTVLGMLATVAWFFWNPKGWVFQWEPLVVFLLTLAGFIATEVTEKRTSSKKSIRDEPHPNDVSLFGQFLQLLPSDGVIEFLRQHDFLEEFELDRVRPIREFLYRWDNAEHEFQDSELEKLRKETLNAANELSHDISKYTSPNAAGLQAVRFDRLKHIEEHEERFRKEAEIVNSAAKEFVEKHQELVRVGRRLCELPERSDTPVTN